MINSQLFWFNILIQQYEHYALIRRYKTSYQTEVDGCKQERTCPVGDLREPSRSRIGRKQRRQDETTVLVLRFLYLNFIHRTTYSERVLLGYLIGNLQTGKSTLPYPNSLVLVLNTQEKTTNKSKIKQLMIEADSTIAAVSETHTTKDIRESEYHIKGCDSHIFFSNSRHAGRVIIQGSYLNGHSSSTYPYN